jgi:diguanylate cyclase (GGDEF)-like protein/PAS domain S-box-containing protein
MSKPISSENDYLLDNKVTFLNSVFLFAGIVALGMSFYRWQFSPVMGMIDFVFAICNFGLIYYLNHHKEKTSNISTIAIILSYFLFTAIYLLAPYNSTRISLFFLLSASAFFLKGRQSGFIWLILIILTIVVGHFLPGFETAYSHIDIVTSNLYLIALYFIFRNYEIFNEKVNERELERELLRVGEERFRTLVESGNDIIGIISETGRIRFISASIRLVLGYTPDELIDHPFSGLIHPDEQSKVVKILTGVLAHPDGDALGKFEFRMQHKDRDYRQIEMIASNRISNPVIGGIVLNGRDITESKQAEKALRESEFRLRIMLENDLVGIATVKDRTIQWTNPTYEKLLGYEQGELNGVPARVIYKNDDDYQAMGEKYYPVIKAGKVYRTEQEFVRKDGSRIIVDVSGGMLNPEKGETLWIYIDITERKLIEEQQRRLSAILMQSNEPVTLIDVDGCYVYANPAFCNIFGYELDELMGKSISLVMPLDEDSGSTTQQTIAIAQNQGSFQGEVKRRAKDGKIIPLLLKVSPFRNEQGEQIGYIATMTDLTEIKLIENQLRDNVTLSHTIFDSISDGLHGLNRNGEIIFENAAATTMLGWGLDEMIGRAAHKTIHHSRPDGSPYPQSECHIYATLNDGVTRNIQDEVFWRKDGTSFPVEYISAAMRNAAGDIIGTIVSFRDITDRKQAAIVLQQQNQFSEDIINSLPGVFYMLDMEGGFIRMNTQFMEVTGYSKTEFDRMNALDLFEGEDKIRISQRILEVFENGASDAEAELVTKTKRKIPYFFTGRRTNIDEQSYLVGIGMDITEEKRAQERIEKLAHFDQLTGLPNRILLNDHFKYALSLAQRNNQPLAVMFLDIDHFKNINDTLGHSIGDLVLMEAAKRIKTALREEDTLSRQGGDEFILILPGSDIDGAALIASKLINAVSQPCYVEQHELIVTPSIGIAVYPHDGTDLETLSKNADSAMYKAKREGRNDFRFYTPEMQVQSARNLKLAIALRHALARNELVLHYQPQLSMQDGHIIGAEALLRWQHPEIGMISPAEFIPIAEETGQIIQIGEWVLRAATKQLKDWMNGGLSPMVMAVNLSAVQFRQVNLPELVTRILDEVKLPHQYLELELTEAAMMDNPLAAIAVMDNLHEHGIRMSIDDFGTGYSSLSYLKKFKVYKLKIDQSFVRDISEDPEDKAIVSAIINLASSLGLQTIAEGVETASQLSFLRLQGCNEVQGYYFSKPLTVENFESFAKNNNGYQVN